MILLACASVVAGLVGALTGLGGGVILATVPVRPYNRAFVPRSPAGSVFARALDPLV